ncbi:hypothetical protein U1Q18_030090 [Sarracenia purpurea var. burkii]
MSTVVCQGLQSLDSHLGETRTLSLKLAFQKPFFFEPKAASREISYVHPMAKRSSPSILTGKSLELCTENLGSETGTDTTEGSDFSLSSSDSDEAPAREKARSRRCGEDRKVVNGAHDFPPPLTTISGGSSFLQVRGRREGGRLIIKAVGGAAPPRGCFRAERSHGRLRLCFSNDCGDETFETRMLAGEDDESDMEEVDFKKSDDDEEMFAGGNEESDMEEVDFQGNDEGKEDEEGEEEDEGDDDEEESEVYMREDMEGNNLDGGVETGIENFGRPCTVGGCGHKSLCNWEPFWVAT